MTTHQPINVTAREMPSDQRLMNKTRSFLFTTGAAGETKDKQTQLFENIILFCRHHDVFDNPRASFIVLKSL